MSDFPGLTDIHAHPAMNAFLWDRDLRKHYFNGSAFNPLASLSDFKMLEKGGVKVLWSSLHVPEPEFFACKPINIAARFTAGGRALLKRNAWECLLMQLAKMERQVARAESKFEIARSNADLDRIRNANKTAIVHTLEGGNPLTAGLQPDDRDGALQRLQQLADKGIASITLAHLFPNDLAGHTYGIPAEQRSSLICPLDEKVDDTKGLTPTGEAVVEKMVELKILPDVTHCTPPARAQILDTVANRIPVVATHTGVRTLHDVDYNLDEPSVKRIAESNGVIGVIFMPYWLDGAHPKKGLDPIWRTMEQLRDWSGGTYDHVAIGTDFDGFTDPPDDCKNAGELPRIKDMLGAKGLSEDDQEKILGGNARRVLRDGWREN